MSQVSNSKSPQIHLFVTNENTVQYARKGVGKGPGLRLAFINVFVWVLLCSLALLLLFLPEFSHREQFEVRLVGGIFRKNIIVVFLPASVRLGKKYHKQV